MALTTGGAVGDAVDDLETALDRLGGNADDHVAGGDIFDDHGVGADVRAFADLDGAEDLGAGADLDAIADVGRARQPRAAADDDAGRDEHIAPEPGLLVDHDADAAVAELGAGADLGLGRQVRAEQMA